MHRQENLSFDPSIAFSKAVFGTSKGTKYCYGKSDIDINVHVVSNAHSSVWNIKKTAECATVGIVVMCSLASSRAFSLSFRLQAKLKDASS